MMYKCVEFSIGILWNLTGCLHKKCKQPRRGLCGEDPQHLLGVREQNSNLHFANRNIMVLPPE